MTALLTILAAVAIVKSRYPPRSTNADAAPCWERLLLLPLHPLRCQDIHGRENVHIPPCCVITAEG